MASVTHRAFALRRHTALAPLYVSAITYFDWEAEPDSYDFLVNELQDILGISKAAIFRIEAYSRVARRPMRDPDSENVAPVLTLLRDVLSITTIPRRTRLGVISSMLADELERGAFARTGNQMTEKVGEMASVFLSKLSTHPLASSKDAEDLLNSVLRAEIPYAASPRVKSSSLKDLLGRAEFIVYAPVVEGMIVGLQRMCAGDFFAAVLTQMTGGIMTLLILGTVLLSDKMVKYVNSRPLLHDDILTTSQSLYHEAFSTPLLTAVSSSPGEDARSGGCPSRPRFVCGERAVS